MIKKFSKKYLASLTTLLNDSFKIETTNKEKLVDWKYFDKYLNDKTITYIVIDDTDSVVSHYTNIPITVSADRKYKAMVCTDMCTDPKFRGLGLISQLSSQVYSEVRKQEYDFSIGFSNDQGIQVDKHSDKYGYQIIGRFVRYFKFVLFSTNARYKLEKNINIVEFEDNSSYYKIFKSPDYITWRYIRKPNNDYEIFDIKDGEKTIGLVVLRFKNYKCYVYDIISNPNYDIKKIMQAIDNLAMQRAAPLIIYNVLDNNYWKKVFGMFYFKKTYNHTNYYLTIKIHNKNVDEQKLINKENWLVMNGDIL